MLLTAEELRARAQKIRLILTDVDGVWTNGKLSYVPGTGEEMVEVKSFNTQDGMAFRWAHTAGLKTGLISGRESPGVTHRARMLGVTYIYQNFLEKIPPYEEILKHSGLGDAEVAYLGDDLPDVPLMRRVGLGVAVANARPQVKGCAHYITAAHGGDGAIREVMEIIMEAQGIWAQILEKYGVS